jgi:hypothetical protein
MDGGFIDYAFDLTVIGADGKKLETYAFGQLIDTQVDDGSKTWEDLVTAAVPAIVADIEAYGVG